MHRMGIEEFPLAWRWTKSAHTVLPPDVLTSMVSLQGEEADRLYRRGEEVFRAVVGSRIQHVAEDPDVARAWLQSLPFTSDNRVFLAWNNTTALSLPWHSFIAYWDDFCYPSSDDVFAFPEVGSGALAWNHEGVFEFAENAV